MTAVDAAGYRVRVGMYVACKLGWTGRVGCGVCVIWVKLIKQVCFGVVWVPKINALYYRYYKAMRCGRQLSQRLFWRHLVSMRCLCPSLVGLGLLCFVLFWCTQTPVTPLPVTRLADDMHWAVIR